MKPSLSYRLRNVASRLPLDAKRKPYRQQGVESWYPYYAGFTEDFARGVLAELADHQPFCVMDPWNGSGTTTRVSHELGHEALGFDINPVASLVASAKVACPDDARHVIGLAKRLGASKRVVPRDNDPLQLWLAPSVVAQYRGIEAALVSELATTMQGARADVLDGGFPPLASFLLLALIRTTREIANVFQGTNPTWVRPSQTRKRAIRTLGTRWVAQVANMAADLQDLRTNQRRRWSGSIGVADSRNLPVNNESIDLILTSPPYCTRIDYVVSTSFELAALGVADETPEYGDLRRATMGTPLARKGPPPDIPEQWPRGVWKLLDTVRRHPSKASRSYYYKTFFQYFDDAIASLGEFARVLRPGAGALLVVQTSYYKDLLVDLPRLYLEMAEHVGLGGKIVGEAEVPRALAQINPNASLHRKNADYLEAVIALEKSI